MAQHHLRRLKEVFSSNTCVKQTQTYNKFYCDCQEVFLQALLSCTPFHSRYCFSTPRHLFFCSIPFELICLSYIHSVLASSLSHWAVRIYRFLRPASSPPLYHHYVRTAFHSVRQQSLNCVRMRQTTFCLVKLLPACFQHVGRLCVWVINSAAFSVSPFPESHLLSLFLLLERPINHFLRVPVFCRRSFTHVSFRRINKVTCYPLFSLYFLWTVSVLVFCSLTSEQ